MIYGIGTDILAVKRIANLMKKYGDALPRRILSHIEQHEFDLAGARKVHFLAKRFAAKEAFSKAVGTGIRGEVSFQNISIGHNRLGRPEFLCEPALQNWLDGRGIVRIHLSLSDEADYVSAFAVAEAA